MSSNIGNYFQDKTFPSLVINEETITSKVLSKLIRSGTSKVDIQAAIKAAKVVTDENLCDALDREVSMDVFEALIAKVESIGESPLNCAIYQKRSPEVIAMLNSGKICVSPEWALEKAKSGKVVDALLAHYPNIVVTDENLCNALENGVSTTQFLTLLAKVGNIRESAIAKAIYSDRSEELIAMLNSGKTSVSPEWALEKAETSKVVQSLLTQYPVLETAIKSDISLRHKFNKILPHPPARSFDVEEHNDSILGIVNDLKQSGK